MKKDLVDWSDPTLKRRSALPKPRVVNKRMILSNMDVKRLVDHASTVRDRAIILTMFQSGIDVSTLCSLKYGDVAEGLAKNEHPLRLNLYRPKTGTEYYTFIGRDAVEAIRAYLNDLKAKGIKMTPNTTLFLKVSHKTMKCEGLTPNLVQNMLREVAVKSGLVDENFNGRDFNPLSPHALRESFASIMINKGVPDTIVDFWLGHEIGEMADFAVLIKEVKDLGEKWIKFSGGPLVELLMNSLGYVKVPSEKLITKETEEAEQSLIDLFAQKDWITEG